jgi:hypothetical protein
LISIFSFLIEEVRTSSVMSRLHSAADQTERTLVAPICYVLQFSGIVDRSAAQSDLRGMRVQTGSAV